MRIVNQKKTSLNNSTRLTKLIKEKLVLRNINSNTLGAQSDQINKQVCICPDWMMGFPVYFFFSL